MREDRKANLESTRGSKDSRLDYYGFNASPSYPSDLFARRD